MTRPTRIVTECRTRIVGVLTVLLALSTACSDEDSPSPTAVNTDPTATATAPATTTSAESDAGASLATEPGVVFSELLPAAFGTALAGTQEAFTTSEGESWAATLVETYDDALMVMIERRADPDPDVAGRGFGDVVGGGLWRRDGGAWRLVAFDRGVVEMTGSLGDPIDPEPELLMLGDHRGVIYRTAAIGQGLLLGGLTVIAVVGSELRVVLDVRETAGSNSGICPQIEPCYDFDSSLSVIEGGSADWPDLALITTGTRLVDGAVVSADDRRICTWNGTGYVPHPDS